MTTHELKTWPIHFDAVRRGVKKAELRRDDRDFQTGDVLSLREWNPETKEYTGERLTRMVLHVIDVGEWQDDYTELVVLSLGTTEEWEALRPSALEVAAIDLGNRVFDQARIMEAMGQKEAADSFRKLAEALRETDWTKTRDPE